MQVHKKQLLIIGSGTMGNGIAHSFAQYQFPVLLFDTSSSSLQKGLQQISTNLERQISKGSISVSDKETILANITPIQDLEKACATCDLVIEAVPELIEIKKEVFQSIDKHCKPETILASNTSSISITKLASFTGRPDKVVGMHFMNPVPIMPLVEIIAGLKTSENTIEAIQALTRDLQKTPVHTNDFPGFISNRILMPMINEAIYSYYEGVAGIAEIDQIMKLGMAHPMGPLQLADYIGLDVCLNIMHVLYEGFNNPKYAPCPLLTNMVQAGFLGNKTKSGFYDWSDPKNLQVNKQLRKNQ